MEDFLDMYISMLKIYPLPGRGQNVIDVLDSIKGPIATKADYLDCTITVESEGNGTICYQERWRTREALEHHLRSVQFGRVLEAMELSCTPPEVMFFKATEIGGLELVEQARTSQ